MPARPENLPDFTDPPINEVVFSVQFNSLPKFGNAHVGLFWGTIRDRYPIVAEQPPIQSLFEAFGGTPSPPQFEIAISPTSATRYWFISRDEEELLQIQPDRFLRNWRHRIPGQVYPRYETLRERFIGDLRQFVEFLEKEKLGTPKINQCELSYINVITLDDTHAAFSKVSTLWGNIELDRADLVIENSSMNTKIIMSDEGKPVGRLHITITPGVRVVDNCPVVKIDLTARGKPRSETVSSAFDFIDRCRLAIVSTFAAITTPEMHKRWGRTS
jgi:uncharacterized protein (TIGR04255 family)